MTKEREKEKRQNEFTTVRLERDLVEQLQEKMSYTDTYNDYLKNTLEV
jgi:SHS2 domain-containing protein